MCAWSYPPRHRTSRTWAPAAGTACRSARTAPEASPVDSSKHRHVNTYCSVLHSESILFNPAVGRTVGSCPMLKGAMGPLGRRGSSQPFSEISCSAWIQRPRHDQKATLSVGRGTQIWRYSTYIVYIINPPPSTQEGPSLEPVCAYLDLGGVCEHADPCAAGVLLEAQRVGRHLGSTRWTQAHLKGLPTAA